MKFGYKNSWLFFTQGHLTRLKTRVPMGLDRSPKYNKQFCYKLDFLANQKAWLPYLWNQSKKQTRGPKALNPSSIISNFAMSFFTGKLHKMNE